jgi:hypothetical protein
MTSGKLLTIKDIPDCADVPRIGVIPAHHLFPVFSLLRTDPPIWIHSDGSLFQLFEIHDFMPGDIQFFMDRLHPGMAFQLYKLQVSGIARFFLSVIHPIAYDYLNVTFKDAMKRFFLGVEDIGVRLSRDTQRAAAAIGCFGSDRITPVAWQDSALIPYLVDTTLSGPVPTPAAPVRSNVSALQTGRNRFSLVSSINNVDWVPNAPGILSGMDFLLCLTCVRPLEAQMNAIASMASENHSLLSSLAPRETASGSRVDTIYSEDGETLTGPAAQHGAYFLDATFLLTSSQSLADLNTRSAALQEALGPQGVLLFQHGVSARAQYVSLFPGNAVYGEHYHTAYQSFVFTFGRKVMGL